MSGSGISEITTNAAMEDLFDYMFSEERETIKGEASSLCCPYCPYSARERNCFACIYKRN